MRNNDNDFSAEIHFIPVPEAERRTMLRAEPEEHDPFAEFGGLSVAHLMRIWNERAADGASGYGSHRGRGPLLSTDMDEGTTTFYKGDGSPPIVIRTRNAAGPGAHEDANAPFSTPDIVGVEHRGDTAPYGKDGAYIKTGDIKGRDIHGGGSSLPNPTAARQPLMPTQGCTRGHNDDIVAIGEAIEEFRRRHPGMPIPYERH